MDAPSTLLAGAVVLLLTLAALRYRRGLFHAVERFFTEPATPFNLAVFRITFFGGTGLLLLFGHWDLAATKSYSELPAELVIAPQGMGAIADHIPLSHGLVSFAYAIALVSCGLACVGLFTRPACWSFLLSMGYYLTVPQLFGKVDHYHHVLWLGLIFAVSRPSDALSLDAIGRIWRRDAGAPVMDQERHLRYSLPLRISWLLLGLIYLFPGLYKYRANGLGWLDPSTLESWIDWRSYDLGGWQTPIPVEQMPLGLSVGAGFALLFECSFLLLVIFPRLRPLLAMAGLGFHASTALLMRIRFYSLMVAYASLIDWERLSRWFLGRRSRLVLGYDGSCGLCRKTVGALMALSLPGGIRHVDVLDEAALAGSGLDRFDRAALLADMHLTEGGRAWRGYEAYRRLAWRVPLLWPLLPLLYLPPVTYLGERLYLRVAWSRACAATSAPHPVPARPGRRTAGILPLCVTGALLLIGGMGTGLLHVHEGWPLSHYPTFSNLEGGAHRRLLLAQGRTSTDRVERIDMKRELAFMEPHRYFTMIRKVLDKPERERTRALRALVEHVRPVSRDGKPFVSIVLGDATVAIYPDRASRVVSSSPLLTTRIAGAPQTLRVQQTK